MITGPRREAELPDVSDAAVRVGLIIEEFRPDFGGLLAVAELSISQAGYNTVSDVLSAGCRAVLSPFAGEGETEQTLRGAKLKSRKLAEVIPEVELDAPSLAAAVEQTLALPKPSAHGLDLDGARNSARELRQLLAIKPSKAL